ncbi:hypothetical protein ACFLRP_02085 [Bacteroidota bacterium]
MPIKGKRKFYNDKPSLQLDSIRRANPNGLPLYVKRRPAKVTAIHWQTSDGRWAGYMVVSRKLVYAESDKKPRSGVIIGDGKRHLIWVVECWYRIQADLPPGYTLFQYLCELFKRFWKLDIDPVQLRDAQVIYREKMNNSCS